LFVVSCHQSVATNNGRGTTDLFSSPTRVTHAGNQALVSQFAETNPADAKFLIHGPGATAQLATILAPRAKFWHTLRFGDF
jgi:hypothetical protein